MKPGISFKISAMVSGQKSSVVNAAPQLIANSTAGKFTITAPVSKAMNIAVGERIQFFNNYAAVEEAVNAVKNGILEIKDENNETVSLQFIADFVAEQGYDLNVRENFAAVVNEYASFYIGKGVAQFKKNGEPLTVPIRMTEDEKKAYILENAAEIVAANREALIERNGGNDGTDEELAALVDIDEIEYPKVQNFSGARTATTSNATGVGCNLGFTDTVVWSMLKQDLGEEKTKKNRIYDVDLDTPRFIYVNNGKEDVQVTVYAIKFVEDKDVATRVGSKQD